MPLIYLSPQLNTMLDNHFEVFLADTPESKEIHYSIRYQVYCEEKGFENKNEFLFQMEYDEHDDRSVHFIVRDKTIEKWVGAMRLIFKQNGLLPIEQSCKINEYIHTNDLFKVVELSRLCLLKEVRKTRNDIGSPNKNDGNSHHQKESENIKLTSGQHNFKRKIIWGLFHAAAEYASVNNIQHCYFMTTSSLAKILRRGGLNLLNIGEPCQHKGERHPFKMNAVEAYQSNVWQDNNKSYGLFSEWSNNQSVRFSSAA